MPDVTKGPGDLWIPPDEPEFDRSDAAGNVAERWHVDGETGVIVETVADAEGLLLWIGANLNVPLIYLRAYRDLLGLSGKLDKAVSDELESLLSPSDPRDDDE